MAKDVQLQSWLRERLRSSGLSIAALAKKSGVSKATIHRILSDDYEFTPTRSTAAKLEAALSQGDVAFQEDNDGPFFRGEILRRAMYTDDRMFLSGVINQIHEGLINSITKRIPDPDVVWYSEHITFNQLVFIGRNLLIAADQQLDTANGLFDLYVKSIKDSEFKLDEAASVALPGMLDEGMEPELLKPSIQIWLGIFLTTIAELDAGEGIAKARRMLERRIGVEGG